MSAKKYLKDRKIKDTLFTTECAGKGGCKPKWVIGGLSKLMEDYKNDYTSFTCNDCDGEIFEGDQYCRHCGEIFE